MISDKTHYNIVINFPFGASPSQKTRQKTFSFFFIRLLCSARCYFFFFLVSIENSQRNVTNYGAIIGFQSIRAVAKCRVITWFQLLCKNQALLMWNSRNNENDGEFEPFFLSLLAEKTTNIHSVLHTHTHTHVRPNIRKHFWVLESKNVWAHTAQSHFRQNWKLCARTRQHAK